MKLPAAPSFAKPVAVWRMATTRPSANSGGGGCTSWVQLLGHNALCKHDSPLPNSGPCCEPIEADRTSVGPTCSGNRDSFPCPSCLDKCTGGKPGSTDTFILGKTDSLEECLAMASSFAEDGLTCYGLTWVAPNFGGPGGSPWESKCICGTSDASWPTTPVMPQAKVDSAYCTGYALGWGYTLLLALTLLSASYVSAGVYFGKKRSGQQQAAPGLRGQLSLHPHYSQWCSVKGLVEDGVSFSRAWVQGKRSVRGGGAHRESPLLPSG